MGVKGWGGKPGKRFGREIAYIKRCLSERRRGKKGGISGADNFKGNEAVTVRLMRKGDTRVWWWQAHACVRKRGGGREEGVSTGTGIRGILGSRWVNVRFGFLF